MYLCEIVNSVLKHILMYGMDPAAHAFLTQIWEDEVTATTGSEGLSFLQIKMVEILLDSIFGELFADSTQSKFFSVL